MDEHQPQPPPAPAAPGRPLRRVLRGLGWALAGLALALVAAWAALQVPATRQALARAAVEAAVGPGTRVEIQGLGPGLPFTLSVERLALADAAGPWLSVEGLILRWSPWPLLAGRLDITSLTARTLALLRLPEAPEGEAPDRTGSEPAPAGPLRLPRASIRELALDEVFLAAAVVDRDLRLAVRSSLRPVPGGLGLALDTAALDGRPDRISLNATLARDLSTLALDLRADEAPGGFLGWTLGLSDHIPLSVSLAGSGGPGRWAGAFGFHAPGALDVDVDLSLEDEGGLILRGHGRAVLAPDIAPARLEDLWRGGVNATFTARPDLDGLIRVERLDLAGPTAAATATGWVNVLDLDLDAAATLTLADPARLLAGSGFAVLGLKPLDLHGTGLIKHLNLDLRGRADSLRLHGLALDEPRLDLTARPFTHLYRRDPGLAANATLAGRRLDLDGAPLADSPVLDAAMSTSHFTSLEFPAIRLRAHGLDLDLDGELDAATLAARAGLRLSRWDGREFPQALGLPLSGRAQALVRADLGRLSGRAELTGQVEGLPGLHPAVAALTGPAEPLAAVLGFSPQRLDLVHFFLGNATARLTGSGDWNVAHRDFRAQAALDADQAGPLGQALGLDLAGGLAARATAQGAPADFAAQAEARVDGLSLPLGAGLDLGPTRAGAVLAGLPTDPRGGLSLSARPAAGPLDISAGLSTRHGPTLPGLIRLRAIRGHGPGLDLAGDLDLDPATGLATGKLRADLPDPLLLRGLLGRRARGSARLDLELAARGATQAADLDLAVRALSGDVLSLKSLDASASLEGLFGPVRGTARLAGQGLNLGGLDLAEFSGKAQGDRQAARFDLSCAGEAGRPLKLAARGSLAVDGLLHVGLESLTGSWDGRRIALASPADLDLATDSLALHGLDLDLAGGSVRATGSIGPGGADLDATARDLPLLLAAFLLPLPLDGKADADLTARGTARNPDIALDLALRQVERAGLARPGPVLGLTATARLRDGRLDATAGLDGLGPGRLDLAAALPLRLSLRPWNLDLPPQGELAGSLRGEVDPAALARLLDLEGHTLAGRAILDLKVAGSPADPFLDGSAELAQGRYENAFLGLLLTDLTARLDAWGRRLELASLSATGPEKGRLSGTGRLDLEPDLPYALDLNLDKLAPVRHDWLSLSATGRAGLSGNATAARLSGALALEPVEVRIPDRLPPDIPELEITEVNLAPDREPAPAEAPAPALDLGMDLDLSFPGRCFVRGRGLDAEFTGRLRITGQPEAPAVNGTLSVVRGRYEFLGKSFAITSGSMDFDGVGATPFLNVVAETATGDITARARLVGPARSFSLSLESEPALPRDEILARMLFGGSTASLNPVQAAQLANAVRMLTLGGPSLDPTTTVRQALGLDQLGVVDSESDKGPGLTMGKYLRDNVYIEVRQDLTKGGEEVSLEVELAPNLGVESTTGTERSGVGLNWKKDY